MQLLVLQVLHNICITSLQEVRGSISVYKLCWTAHKSLHLNQSKMQGLVIK
jgi:hypothetical protein